MCTAKHDNLGVGLIFGNMCGLEIFFKGFAKIGNAEIANKSVAVVTKTEVFLDRFGEAFAGDESENLIFSLGFGDGFFEALGTNRTGCGEYHDVFCISFGGDLDGRLGADKLDLGVFLS